jgi:hypothetical protein
MILLIQDTSNLLFLRQTGRVCASSFPPNRSPKNEENIHFVLACGLMSPKRARKVACAALWLIFSSNKSEKLD